MAEGNKKGLLRNEYVETAIMIIVIVGVVLGFWYGSQFVLNTQYPALAVASGSMCVPYGQGCDGWSHPFARTLHVGDLIVIQGVKPEGINAAPYPNGDIIVYRSVYDNTTLIVHRAIGKSVNANGTIIGFIIKGDANPAPDNGGNPIPADRIIGRVVMRIPWVGHLALFMRNSQGVYIVVAIIILLVVVEFLIPEFRQKKKPEEKSGEA